MAAAIRSPTHPESEKPLPKKTAHALATISLALLPLAATTVAPPAATAETRLIAESGFRVLPYLQSPSSTSMTINWISERDIPGVLSISGP
ncbi:MAG: hypothetical protein Q4F67_02435, partial [Propionibacteriaceae bacterium]|nr:hypothetical protein [Propionibacteriaceae bacterium]